jgi:hypothetical protein
MRVHTIEMLADATALAYHEARNVRFLIRDGFLSPEGWVRLRDLPANRLEAWRRLHPVRCRARDEVSSPGVFDVFETEFGRSLGDLRELFSNEGWRHSGAYGGHAWLGIVAAIEALGAASDPATAATAVTQLRLAAHNNGHLREKLRGLDQGIAAIPSPVWLSDER